MDNLLDTSEYLANLFDTIKKAKSAKPIFEKYIADKSIPLDERWDMFVHAPMEFRKHQNYVAIDIERYGNYTWYDTFHVDRHETVDCI